MALEPNSTFGNYHIGDSLGVGGMGEVYRATDTKLKREVAIKVLPDSFATDADRLARFQREAETLASLNHPNIGMIFGLEIEGDATAIVMELVEGPTLADRIAEGPIPPDEALRIAKQIIDGLEAAHDKGIVHRDLKPANIKVKEDGLVKILDFGIAKAMDTQTGNSGPVAPALTTPAMTQSGMILGTAAYMSPEQARGKTVDRRTDIWAFGCVLYEMLTGQPAFGAEDVPLTLARVLSQATDFKSLPAGTTPALRQAIELCLEKEPKKRLADISDVRLVLTGRFETPAVVTQGTRATSIAPWLVGGMAATVIAALAGWSLKPVPVPDLSVNRFAYAIPEEHALRNTGRNVLAVSPDGRRFAYNTTQGLFLRELGQLDARLVPGTAEGLSTPFFSPDGESLAYMAGGQLKRIAITGGAPVILASDIVNGTFDASWSAANSIYYSQATGIWRVPATGGTPELVIAPQGQESLSNPELLPDDDTLLYSVKPAGLRDGEFDKAAIVAQSLTTGERTVLVQGGSDPQYVPTGHLVYGFEDGLFAVAFDADTLSVSGGIVPLVQGVVRADATSNYRVSVNGTLVYLSGARNSLRTLLWVNRDGSESPIPIEPGSFTYPRMSPDGNRVTLGDAYENGLWVWDFSAETRTQMTIGAASGAYGAWTPDGTRIAYTGTENSIDWKAANNTGQGTRMTDFTSTGGQAPSAYFFSPSGQELVYRNQATLGTDDDIAMIAVGGTAEPIWLLRETWIERNAELSPNGRWMAYQSNESGQFEVYVRPFPNVDDDRVQVSNAGGEKPLWSRDGNELFYLQPDASGSQRQMMSVGVATEAARFTFSSRTALMDWPYVFAVEGRTYEVAPDGQRFLAITPFVDPDESGNAAPQVIIIQNWTEELKRLVPVE